MAKINAIVIGGGTISDPTLSTETGVDCKSLISLNGKPMIQWVVESLKASEHIGSVAVIGPVCLQVMDITKIADHVLHEGDHEVDNVIKGIKALPDSERILMVSGDVPLISQESIADLANNAPDAQVVYTAVQKDAAVRAFPHRKWVFLKTKEGELTGSSTVMFDPATALKHHETMRKIFDARRNVASLATIFGPSLAIKYALGQLSVRDVESKISEVLKIKGRAYISKYAELAFDVDHASDVSLACQRLQSPL